MENEELAEDVDIERILTGDDSQRLPKMCIKCFRAYRTCSKHHQDIQNKLRKALETLDMVNNSPQAHPPAQQTPSAKRPRLVPFHRGMRLRISPVLANTGRKVSPLE